MSLFAPYDGPYGPSWPPSRVRQLLVERRTGAKSVVLRDDDGTDRRQAVTSMVGDQATFETLSYDEAHAARDLLAALHRGELDAFAVDEAGARYWLAPAYWEPRHDLIDIALGDSVRKSRLPLRSAFEDHGAWRGACRRFVDEARRQRGLQRSAIIWAEDSVLHHLDRAVAAERVGWAIRIDRGEAQAWVAATVDGGKSRRTPRLRAPDDLFDLLIAELNEAGVSKRDVDAPAIAQRWKGGRNNTPTVAEVQAAIEGGIRGRPAGA